MSKRSKVCSDKVGHVTSVIKYPGGKLKLLTRIFEDAMPPHVPRETFIDVFGGSGVVGANAWRYGFRKVRINDLNHSLVSLYRCLKRDPHLLMRKTSSLFTWSNNSFESYMHRRNQFNSGRGKRGKREERIQTCSPAYLFE